jgi:hypothetical protein
MSESENGVPAHCRIWVPGKLQTYTLRPDSIVARQDSREHDNRKGMDIVPLDGGFDFVTSHGRNGFVPHRAPTTAIVLAQHISSGDASRVAVRDAQRLGRLPVLTAPDKSDAIPIATTSAGRPGDQHLDVILALAAERARESSLGCS